MRQTEVQRGKPELWRIESEIWTSETLSRHMLLRHDATSESWFCLEAFFRSLRESGLEKKFQTNISKVAGTRKAKRERERTRTRERERERGHLNLNFSFQPECCMLHAFSFSFCTPRVLKFLRFLRCFVDADIFMCVLSFPRYRKLGCKAQDWHKAKQKNRGPLCTLPDRGLGTG